MLRSILLMSRPPLLCEEGNVLSYELAKLKLSHYPSVVCREHGRELIPLTFPGNYLAFGVRSVAAMRSIYVAMVFERNASAKRSGS